MNQLLIRTLLATLLLSVCATTLASGSMRCGTRLVEQGMNKDDVVKICGEPTTTEKYGSVWIYDQKPSEMLKVLTFVNGEVDFIDERSRETERD